MHHGAGTDLVPDSLHGRFGSVRHPLDHCYKFTYTQVQLVERLQIPLDLLKGQAPLLP